MCAIDQLLHTQFSIIFISEFTFSHSLVPRLSPHASEKSKGKGLGPFPYCKPWKVGRGLGTRLIQSFFYPCTALVLAEQQKKEQALLTAKKNAKTFPYFTAAPEVHTLPKGMFLLVYHVMFQTAHSPRWRRVVSAIGSPASSLCPPNMTTILKFGPDPNTVAVCRNRGPISCGRVTCTGGGNSN